MIGRRRLRSAAALLLLSGFAAAAAGCSVLPFRSIIRPDPTAPAGEDDAAAPADSTAGADSTLASGSVPDPDALPSAEPDGAPDSTGESDTAKELPAPEVVPPATPAPATPEPVTPEPAEPKPPPAPDPGASDQVTVQISDAERAQLETQARESLREARRVIRTIDRTTLSPDRLEKLAAAESLVEQARAAFDADVRASATLAHKASVLLAELTAK